MELPRGEEYHTNAIKLNTGRNAFEYILKGKRYSKVFVPYYTCDVMLEPLKKLGLNFEFYHIDETFRPIFEFSNMLPDEGFVYTNYFGFCDRQVDEVTAKCRNLIVDNSQAFFSGPIPKIDTFYSPRKFFGVPDGGYLYTETQLIDSFQKDNSINRLKHLTGRIENSASAHYEDFKSNEQMLSNQPIKSMSNLTMRLLAGIDYRAIKLRRRENFEYLHSKLASKNKLSVNFNKEAVPLVYPFLSDIPGLRQYLISQNIFVPQYWPNVLNWAEKGCFEWNLTNDLLCLPIDQRVTFDDLDEVLKTCNYGG